MTLRLQRVLRFWDDERGVGTTFSLFVFVCLAMIVGLMVDTTNGWRNKTYLQSTADIGAHAGAVAIARGLDDQGIRGEVTRLVQANLPTGFFGQVVDAQADIFLAYYNPETKTFEPSPDTNAVIVRVERTAARGNPVTTFLMQFAGVDSFDMHAISAAVFDVNGDCTASDGVYAKEQVTLTSQTYIGAGFCIHSEERVWLPQQNTFEAGSFVTMPQLALCQNKCQPSANPGIVAIESHMVLPDLNQYILDSYDTFKNGGMGDPTKSEFFSDVVSIASTDIDLLRDQGVLAPSDPTPSVGDTIPLSHAEFHALPHIPPGLVYEVMCASNGNGPNTILRFDGSVGQMENAALLTNCSLDFQGGSRVIGSLVITTRDAAQATVTSSSSVVVSDPALACGENERTIVMSMSKVSVPAEFVMSNLTLIVDDDVDIASATSGAVASQGLAIYATGRVQVAAQHTFYTCGTPDAVMTPAGKIVRIVMAPGSYAK